MFLEGTYDLKSTYTLMESCCVADILLSDGIGDAWGLISAMVMVGGLSLLIVLSLCNSQKVL